MGHPPKLEGDCFNTKQDAPLNIFSRRMFGTISAPCSKHLAPARLRLSVGIETVGGRLEAEMVFDLARSIVAAVILSAVSAHVAEAQLMTTCAENSPERRGELGCSIVASKLLPSDLKEPVFWHIDRFDSLERARAAVNRASVAFDAAGTVWLMTIEAQYSDHHGGRHVTQVGPLPLPQASRYSMVVQSAVFAPGMYSLAHHHSGVEAVYVVEGEACYETPARGFTLRKGETLALPAGTEMRAVVGGSTRRYVLAVIVHDAAQPATMRMAEASAPKLATCK
jgi:quercetin dioxygenase-like cupin family protein